MSLFNAVNEVTALCDEHTNIHAYVERYEECNYSLHLYYNKRIQAFSMDLLGKLIIFSLGTMYLYIYISGDNSICSLGTCKTCLT